MLTSFFGSHKESAYVMRLSQALLDRGHEVHVIYSENANRMRGGHVAPELTASQLHLHALQAGIGPIAPLFTRQTGRVGGYRQQILDIVDTHSFDVIHLHDISLLGGIEIIDLLHQKTNAVKLMSVRDHWLLCPLAKLWQFNSMPCETTDCTRCTLTAGQMPQLWRGNDRVHESLDYLDALIFASKHARDLHQQRGIELAQATVMPSFLPKNWAAGIGSGELHSAEKPYFVMSGELLKENGFQTVIPLMMHTAHANLYIIGTGEYGAELDALAEMLPNVHLLGDLDAPRRAELIANAIAMITPSLLQEPVGDTILEAFSLATPVLVRNRGALPEYVARSGGGMLFDNSAELLDKMHLLLQKPRISKRMGARAIQEWHSYWSESTHIANYIDLVRSTQLRRDVQFV